MKSKILIIIVCVFLGVNIAWSQFGNDAAFAKIDFSDQLHEWDGFGINYVESCQTLDYKNNPQDLGGFTILNENQKQEIIKLVFGKNGLEPTIIKMFLDPWHLETPDAKFDHEWSTQNMRYFATEGLKLAQKNDYDISIITTLYGPPAFMTEHNSPSISRLNPEYKRDMALYMIDWVNFLKKKNYPVKYLSIHNEGTDWLRWPHYENHPNAIQNSRDYNLLWRAEEIADYMTFLKPIMIEQGVGDVGLTPGEPINLFRFNHFGIADAINENPDALKSIDLITSHGFGLGNGFGRGYSNTDNYGATLLQKSRPELKTWITSMSWGKMDARFGAEIYEHIYSNKVSAIIPWAGVQSSSQWYGNNHHPACAILVNEDSTFTVQKGYYMYKQFTQAGKPGMRLVKTSINRPDVFIAAFNQNNTINPDAFVVVNLGESLKYTSDIIEFSFNVNDNPLYYCFPVIDLVQAYDQDKPNQMDNVKFAAKQTDSGYVMEFAFPWKTLGWYEKTESEFSFDVQARDGRDMPHGRIGWLGDNNEFDGVIHLGEKTKLTDNQVTFGKTEKTFTIDGNNVEWGKHKSLSINNEIMPGTPAQIYGQWKMTYDDEKLYILVDMQDPSNTMGREIEMTIKNTKYKNFQAFRTDQMDENYINAGMHTIVDGKLNYVSPNHSITTFIGIE